MYILILFTYKQELVYLFTLQFILCLSIQILYVKAVSRFLPYHIASCTYILKHLLVFNLRKLNGGQYLFSTQSDVFQLMPYQTSQMSDLFFFLRVVFRFTICQLCTSISQNRDKASCNLMMTLLAMVVAATAATCCLISISVIGGKVLNGLSLAVVWQLAQSLIPNTICSLKSTACLHVTQMNITFQLTFGSSMDPSIQTEPLLMLIGQKEALTLQPLLPKISQKILYNI